MKKNKTSKIPKALKIIATILASLLVVAICLYLLLTSNTQILVGMIQKGMYGDSSPNSFESLYTPDVGLTAADS